MSLKYKKTVEKAKDSVTDIRAYDLILSPVVTEKSTRGSENNQVTFKVPLTASKPEIKAAIEKLFNVKVKAVNTLRQNGKRKVFRGQRGVRSDFKKAMVTLVDGSSIDLSAGV